MPRIRFDVNDAELREAFLAGAMLDALAPLREDGIARWGRMTAQQMVEHLSWTFELSTGRRQVECSTPEDQIPRLKTFLLKNRAMPQDFMNPALAGGLPPLGHPGLAEAKRALRLEVDRFREQASRSDRFTHPVFGLLGNEEWSRSHFKHGYHHLLQFGLLEPEETGSGT